jgi:putative ABC transport system permease protein
MARPKWLFRFSTRTRRDVGNDVDDEIAFHLETRVQELIERGWTPEAARREASRQFGDVATAADYCRRLDEDREKSMRMRDWFAELWQDAFYALRLLYRQPGLSTVALLTIAIGIGAATVVFSVVYASLLAPLPYAQADRLMIVRTSLPDFADLRASANVFEESGSYASNQYMLDEEQVLGGVVTPGVFRALGVAPALGRVIDESDGPAPVVVLGHSIWRRRFGGDPDIVGRTIQLSGTGYTVLGVMPPRFQFPARTFQFWAGMGYAMTQMPQQAKNRALRIFQVVGRLHPNLTRTQAQAQLSALAEHLARTYPSTNAEVGLNLVSLEERVVGNVRGALLLALGAVGCLLLIACANVASLSLTRLSARSHELAVRSALGAGRWRIGRQLVTESLITAALGGLLGVLVAWWGLAALPGLIGNRVPRVDEVALSLPVLLAAIAAIVAGGLLVAIVPILHLSVTQIESLLRAGGRSGTDARFGVTLRSVLVVAQIAIAVVVVAGSLVMARSLVRLLTVDTGFSPDRLLTFNLPLVGHATPAGRAEAAARTLDAIAALPGVHAVGGATGLAPVTAQRSTVFEVEGKADAPLNQRSAYFIAASPGYFRALGTTFIAGRAFTPDDREGGQPVAVISQTLARRFFPDGDAIGRRLRVVNPEYSGDWRTIVGVVANVRYQGLDDSDPPVVYVSFAQTPFPWMYVHVRTAGDPMAALGTIRSTVRTVDPRLVLANPQPITALVSESSADPRFRTVLLSSFGAIAMVLSAIGLHGLIAFSVARRAREIAIRVALGASATSVRWRILRHALMLVSAGVGLGLAAAVALRGVLDGMLYETSPSDPAALATVTVLLLATAIAAAIVPARRATRIQPVDALRDG